MKKLSLDQLEVENFTIKLRENELTNSKAGTTSACSLHTLLRGIQDRMEFPLRHPGICKSMDSSAYI